LVENINKMPSFWVETKNVAQYLFLALEKCVLAWIWIGKKFQDPDP
jgi:hypothetical protein